MPNDLFFKDELSAPRFIHKGKTVEVDSKAEIKKKLSRSNSPNHADAFNLTLTYKDTMFRRQKKEAYDFGKPKDNEYLGGLSWMVA
jgi:hypothetical protein